MVGNHQSTHSRFARNEEILAVAGEILIGAAGCRAPSFQAFLNIEIQIAGGWNWEMSFWGSEIQSTHGSLTLEDPRLTLHDPR